MTTSMSTAPSRAFFAAVLAAALFGCRAPAPQDPVLAKPPAAAAQTLSQVLDRELSSFKARTGVHVKNLGTGEEAGVRADQPFNSFSVIKLAILVRAYQLADAGTLNLDQRVEVAAADLRDGSGMLYDFDPGLRVTQRDLLTQMIVTSDNTATDMMLARVGGLDALNAWLKESDFTNTRMVQSMLDGFRQPLVMVDPKYKTLSEEDTLAYWMMPSFFINPRRMDALAARSAELQKAVPFNDVLPKISARWNDDPEYWLGSMTARETGRLLEAIDGGTLASQESSRAMRAILADQRVGALRLPHYLPWPDYFVAHKTGDGPPVIANDVGIIYGPNNAKIVVSFFSAAIAEPYPEHEDRIGRLARAVVDFFATKAAAGAK